MSQRNSQDGPALNIGLPSILLIFVVLCLVSFGILSLVSAHADRNLSVKVLERSTTYYDACNKAEETFCDVTDSLKNIYVTAKNQKEYEELIQEIPAFYSYPISDIQSLEIHLAFLYPETEKGPFYQVTSWQVATTQTLEYDEQLHVIP